MLQVFIESHDARNGFDLKPQRTKVELTLKNQAFGHQLWGLHIKLSFLNLFEKSGRGKASHAL